MINHNAIIADLIECKLTRGQIATKHQCSYMSVIRIIRKHNLFIGRGKRPSNLWQYSGTSKELLYLIGLYITDGNLGFSQSGHARQFIINNTDCLLTDYATECFKKININPKTSTRTNHSLTHLGTKSIFSVSVYNSDFAGWINSTCNYKACIPDIVFTAPIEHQLAFLAGIIDGDGHVTKMGVIRIRGIDMWLSQLPLLLETMQIRTSGFKPTEVLESGTIYNMVSIHRSDFRSLGGWCISANKMERIQNAKDERGYRGQPPKHTCSICGEITASKGHDVCRKCYLESDKFYQHLVRIAPLGGRK